MLDPGFGIPLLNAKDDKATERVAMWGMHPSRVFVSVVQKGHWWCAAFSRNHEEILVLDSLVTTKAVDYHKSEVLKMVEVVDQVFHTLDEGWPTKTITKWPMTSLSMTPQSDGKRWIIKQKLMNQIIQSRVFLEGLPQSTPLIPQKVY
ncbi:uncharacterized protein LOC110737841 [Chenopodium quinoa]|uniref:uncharacterized protein LOC110737841 n=1 Tax=Chenopodium quinoa TaxID=63459 RepID=UPI000B7803C6|nr:uncharacterized protein LOC110737841 [Chenopodium quinoa]